MFDLFLNVMITTPIYLNVTITTAIILKCYYLVIWLPSNLKRWLPWQHGVVKITFKYNWVVIIAYKKYVFPKKCECYSDSYYYSATSTIYCRIQKIHDYVANSFDLRNIIMKHAKKNKIYTNYHVSSTRFFISKI